jgi:hypothetical protein
VGRVPESITVAVNVVTFVFEASAVLSVQFGYSFRLREGESPSVERLPVRGTRVLDLLGMRVETCRVFRNRELVIGFPGDGQLRCLETPDPFESYIIQVGSDEWVV